MAHFEIAKGYEDSGIILPERKTQFSAGYDIAAAADVIIPSAWQLTAEVSAVWPVPEDSYINLEQMNEFTKITQYRPTLVPTGLKCYLEDDKFLMLSVRSSSPLKYWLMLANGVGIIDADYYGNASNDGHIMFQIYNLSPYNLQIQKGEVIGQGIILPYNTVENDNSTSLRTGGFGSTNG